MREIVLYRTASGRCPVQDFLDDLTAAQLKRVAEALGIVATADPVSPQLLKKLSGTEDLWEVRVQHAGNAFRILGFWDGGRMIVLVSAFAKKTGKTPLLELEVAQRRRRDYLSRKGHHG
ncbi:MAG TPA: type II toxin-antitoxin system RelE/ParE family toxin [Longimicrobium sp.]|jgi:phage-related protein|uniref:type II toxin-antitoxin system RelE/ParE family toxin n=1 Tax=Longimicrobium sp. TaxID=2029185 RepID=UPI002ED8D4EC